MTEQRPPLAFPHRHDPLRVHVLVQRDGIPWEIERTVCRRCEQVLSERPLRRPAA